MYVLNLKLQKKKYFTSVFSFHFKQPNRLQKQKKNNA